MAHSLPDPFPASLDDYIRIFMKRKLMILVGTLVAGCLSFTMMKFKSGAAVEDYAPAIDFIAMIRTPCDFSAASGMVSVPPAFHFTGLTPFSFDYSSNMINQPLFPYNLNQVDSAIAKDIYSIRFRYLAPLDNGSHGLELTVGFRGSETLRDRTLAVTLQAINRIYGPYLKWSTEQLQKAGKTGAQLLASGCLKFSAWDDTALAPAQATAKAALKPFKPMRMSLAIALAMISGFAAMLGLAAALEIYERSRSV